MTITKTTIARITPSLECGDAQVRAQCRHLGTVVTITGRVNASNAHLVEQRTRRYVLSEKPVVIDLSGLDSFTQHGISVLHGVQAECDAKGVEWCLVASDRVHDALWAAANQSDFPVAGSVAEALKSFGDAVNARRRLLPILTRTA